MLLVPNAVLTYLSARFVGIRFQEAGVFTTPAFNLGLVWGQACPGCIRVIGLIFDTLSRRVRVYESSEEKEKEEGR